MIFSRYIVENQDEYSGTYMELEEFHDMFVTAIGDEFIALTYEER